MKDEIVDLIQGEVDGVNSPADTAALTRLCEADPVVGTELENAREVSKILSHIADRQPSPTFYNKVMASLPVNPAWMPKTAPRTSWTSFFKLPSRPSLVLAYGVVAGAFVMFAIMASLTGGPQGVTDGLSATMAPIQTEIFSESASTSSGGIVSANAVRSNEGILVSISGDTTPATRITVKIEEATQPILEKTFPAKEK